MKRRSEKEKRRRGKSDKVTGRGGEEEKREEGRGREEGRKKVENYKIESLENFV